MLGPQVSHETVPGGLGYTDSSPTSTQDLIQPLKQP